MMLYFAYGSNMPMYRLQKRCPKAEPKQIATLDGYRLAFSKPGRDKAQNESTKANLLTLEQASRIGNQASLSPGSQVFGVLYDVPDDEWKALDKAEGAPKQYVRTEVEVQTESGETVRAIAYISSLYIEGYPYDWYLEHVIRGAELHGLPQEYAQWIKDHPNKVDPDGKREERERAIMLDYIGNI